MYVFNESLSSTSTTADHEQGPASYMCFCNISPHLPRSAFANNKMMKENYVKAMLQLLI